jgi:prophage regulatory protein
LCVRSPENRRGRVVTGNKNRPIPLAEVEHLTGFKHSKIYNDVAAGKFPKPVRLGSKSVRWVEAEIMAWVAEQIAKRDAA